MTGDVSENVVSSLCVRFKFLLGEWVLSEWRLPLLPLQREASTELQDWPVLDSLRLSSLPADVAGYQLRRTAVDRFPRGVSRQGEWLCYSPRQECLYFVNLAGGFDAYLQLRSPKSRQNLKRSVKRFADKNPEGFQIFTEPGSMAEFHSAAVSISQQTYQTFMLNAGLPDTPEYLSLMQRKASQGEARGYLLCENNRPIAFAWCTGQNDAITYQIVGYLPEYAAMSPGTVLLYLIIQDLFARGKYRLFDFGPGSAFYKEFFSTDKIEFADSYLLRPDLKNSLKLWLLWATECFSGVIGKKLDQLGLKKKIRALMRKSLNKVRS